MSPICWQEKCPVCHSENWLRDDADPNDPSVMDISLYNCWKCDREINLFAGEHHEEYRPHIHETLPEDEFDSGRHVNGSESL